MGYGITEITIRHSPPVPINQFPSHWASERPCRRRLMPALPDVADAGQQAYDGHTFARALLGTCMTYFDDLDYPAPWLWLMTHSPRAEYFNDLWGPVWAFRRVPAWRDMLGDLEFFLGDFAVCWSGSKCSTHPLLRPHFMSAPAQSRSQAKQQQRRLASADASAKYRDSHREAVLEAGRIRAAARRARLRGDTERDALARLKAKESHQRYREGNRDSLALKARKARKKAFIKRHGVHAYIQRSFDAPIPGRDMTPDDEDEGTGISATEAGNDWCYGNDFIDPLLRRY
ncbi:hypothetical protein R3P38DRAFT_3186188 [Favolaschia claudopus]|uniref:Uncharacterized protein n=1 Tax=Favolaschia claudopus TaxID=2862362 RepID=A0AAW0C3N6_9AGAR